MPDRRGVDRRGADSGLSGAKPALGERLRHAMLKPADPNATPPPEVVPRRVDELEAEFKTANDKERLIGLIAAPLAAMIGILIVDADVANDPPATVNGQLNKLHVAVSLYHELTLVLAGLALIMLVTAWTRKRLYLGMTMALYGITVFNLHYWGFGVPFAMAGAWLLVRSYQLRRAWKDAGGVGPTRGGSSFSTAPRANKRYTPPTSRSRRPSRPDPASDAGSG